MVTLTQELRILVITGFFKYFGENSMAEEKAGELVKAIHTGDFKRGKEIVEETIESSPHVDLVYLRDNHMIIVMDSESIKRLQISSNEVTSIFPSQEEFEKYILGIYCYSWTC